MMVRTTGARFPLALLAFLVPWSSVKVSFPEAAVRADATKLPDQNMVITEAIVQASNQQIRATSVGPRSAQKIRKIWCPQFPFSSFSVYPLRFCSVLLCGGPPPLEAYL